jgi:hypothetical protein
MSSSGDFCMRGRKLFLWWRIWSTWTLDADVRGYLLLQLYAHSMCLHIYSSSMPRHISGTTGMESVCILLGQKKREDSREDTRWVTHIFNNTATCINNEENQPFL